MRWRVQPPIAFRSGPPQVRSRVSLPEMRCFAGIWPRVGRMFCCRMASRLAAGEMRRSASGARVCRGRLDNRGQYRAIGISSAVPQVL